MTSALGGAASLGSLAGWHAYCQPGNL